MGWRKPLGHDMQRRRYWALGAATGCWRVYVEEQEGALWGWYQGDSPLDTLSTPWHWQWFFVSRAGSPTNMTGARCQH